MEARRTATAMFALDTAEELPGFTAPPATGSAQPAPYSRRSTGSSWETCSMTTRRGSLTTMEVAEVVSVPEAARRFEIDGIRIYQLLFAGLIQGGPQRDGSVRVSVDSIRDYLEQEPVVG